jgi:hypothetical protein
MAIEISVAEIFFRRQAEIVSYARIFNENEIWKYERICIYGDNEITQYLLSEIAYQNDLRNVCGIVRSNCGEKSFLGVCEINLEDVWDKIDCLVLNCRREDSNIFDVIEQRKPDIKIINIYDGDNYEISFKHSELSKFRNYIRDDAFG